MCKSETNRNGSKGFSIEIDESIEAREPNLTNNRQIGECSFLEFG